MRERAFDPLALACSEVDTEFVSEAHKVASGMAIALSELIDKQINASCGLGYLVLVLAQLRFFVEGTFELRLQVGRERGGFAPRARGVSALPRS